MLKPQSRIGKDVYDGIKTPAVILIVVFILGILGFRWSGYGILNQFWTLALFAVFCLVVLHVNMWKCRNVTNDKSLKFIDAIYLATAFAGIYGILDTQSSIARKEIDEVMRTTTPALEQLHQCKGEVSFDCKYVTNILTEMKSSIWNQKVNEFLVRTHEANFDGKPDPNTKFWSLLREVVNHLTFVDRFAHEESSIRFRLFGFYLLCIGLALRVTKTTAEIAKWHIPKSGSSSNALQRLSTEP